MKAVLISAVAVLAFAGTVEAAQVSAEGATDARMRVVDYDPAEVYRITGVFRTATRIVFSSEESILHVAIGDSVAWEVAAEGHVLFIKPRERHQATNLLVTTERGGETRHYAFELQARSDRTTAAAREAVYQIRFRYPADEQAEAVRALQTATAASEQRLTGLQLQRGAVEGPRNLAYSVQGAESLQPSEVSDNGRFTLLRFPGGQAMPAVFAVTEDGTERLTPFDVRGEFMVLHGTAKTYRLRRGKAVLCIFNEAFDSRAPQTGTGTASPEVDRSLAGGEE